MHLLDIDLNMEEFHNYYRYKKNVQRRKDPSIYFKAASRLSPCLVVVLLLNFKQIINSVSEKSIGHRVAEDIRNSLSIAFSWR